MDIDLDYNHRTMGGRQLSFFLQLTSRTPKFYGFFSSVILAVDSTVFPLQQTIVLLLRHLSPYAYFVGFGLGYCIQCTLIS